MSPSSASDSAVKTPAGLPDLRVSVAGIELKNPIIAASGTFGYGVEFEDIVHLDRLGGLVVKGLSVEPMTGNSAAATVRNRGRNAECDWAAEHWSAGVS